VGVTRLGVVAANAKSTSAGSIPGTGFPGRKNRALVDFFQIRRSAETRVGAFLNRQSR
tara:strand:+ start:664 stop:837 length:174 start_codon:yes stop_codon:yes gene_type:complete